MTTLDDPLRAVLGDRTATVLADALDLHTVGDLLRHYPRRYATRGELTDLDSLVEGEQVTIVAEVASTRTRPLRGRRGSVLEVTVTDGTDRIDLTFFGTRVGYHARQLRSGQRGLFAGRVSTYRNRRQLAHPDYLLLGSGNGDGTTDSPTEQARSFATELIPVYPATAKLASWRIAQCVEIVLRQLDDIPDPLPEHVRASEGLPGLRDALYQIHRPAEQADVATARQRLKWEEALVLQVALAQRRLQAATVTAHARATVPDGLLARFDQALPFTLTAAQHRAGDTIATDLSATVPMHRLLQGDVGSGKTVVALRAMLQVVDAGGQAVLLAPTEVLAQQHHRALTQLLGPLARAGQLDAADRATRLGLLTGSQSAAERRREMVAAASGESGIVVGTHALLEDEVTFADLGLVVVDEQHRFGVEQRAALRTKAGDNRPHMLVMTATPIPRTVAMTVYGDLDTVTLDDVPEGRAPVATHVVPTLEKPHFLERTYARMREEVAQQRQVYIVCPRIGGDETPAEAAPADGSTGSAADTDGDPSQNSAGQEPHRATPQGVVDLADELAEGPLSGLRLAVLHGRLPAEEKDATMRRFAAGEIDVLVATTVIEVGVDVPTASVMAIMDADRFGVSQLHQLRGRVGRSTLPGLCLLVTAAATGTPARDRLDAVARTTNGFQLSRVDLLQRREGDVLGAAQSGRRSSLRLLTLVEDEDLITTARQVADRIVTADPHLETYPSLAAAVTAIQADPEYLEKT
ncbi:ATP-dependent DNA helicase RecG [Lipingzhangella sp. LS1_29]|uniref:ATP-dependent DNA helicase RecG n=1 Tax=Lipingzhangella rawalii TaxID=2055835 RepID=A0ABU2H5S3_9ACTN|nr:ATP-dependent DNA helicase RecG [Lipingzhangella rawalii]MDS1270643.1 ATP-dependent DNA helicase RecG [Lipingzhangella rawalii]